MQDLPVIQRTYDLIKWYVPILNRLPREHKFLLGERIVTGLYDLLEGLIQARYAKEKLTQLKSNLEESRPVPVMLVTASENQTGLGSLVSFG